MYLAVRFYDELSAEELLSRETPSNMPGLWPAEVIEMQDNEELPDGYTKMSRADYDAYRAAHLSDYLAAIPN